MSNKIIDTSPSIVKNVYVPTQLDMSSPDFKSLVDIQRDVLSHPLSEEGGCAESEYVDTLIQSFSNKELGDLKRAFQTIAGDTNLGLDDRTDLIANNWKILYTRKIPTIEEFIDTPKYLGAVQESIWPHIRDWVKAFLSPDTQYRNLILTPSIGTGKSYATCLISFYLILHYYFARDIKKLMGLSQATNLAIVFISFTETKIKELLGEVLINYFNASPLCNKCQTREIMSRKTKEDPSRIHWTTAGDTNFLTIGDRVNLKVTGNLNRILGLSPVLLSYSELNFSTQFNVKPSEAYRMYMDGRMRLLSRFKGNAGFLARTILDSSPEDKQLPLEKYVWEDAHKDPSNMIISGAQWEFQKFKDENEFPLFYTEGKSFYVFLGDSVKKPRILSEGEIANFEPEEVKEIPEDLRITFENSLTKALKDFAGVPAGTDSKLISNIDLIEASFVPSLRNLYTYIHAPADQPPEGLIWNQIKDEFFIKLNNERYEFYRHPEALRYISVDQSEVNDTTGISMCHIEQDLQGTNIFVIDFTLAIVPTKARISLEGIKFFIHDLRRYGNIKVRGVSFDRFQSSNAKEYLKNYEFNVHNLSVDTKMEPYLFLVSLLGQNRIKCGKNIMLKNNYKSLKIVERKTSGTKKVEHSMGEVPISIDDGAPWKTSLVGFNAKDLSDSVSACISLADKIGIKNNSIIWREEDNKLTESAYIKKEMLGDILSDLGLSTKPTE